MNKPFIISRTQHPPLSWNLLCPFLLMGHNPSEQWKQVIDVTGYVKSNWILRRRYSQNVPSILSVFFYHPKRRTTLASVNGKSNSILCKLKKVLNLHKAYHLNLSWYAIDSEITYKINSKCGVNCFQSILLSFFISKKKLHYISL